MRLASGSILAWLNSDDVYHRGTIEAAVKAMEKENAALVCANCRLVQADGRVLKIYRPHLPISAESLLLPWKYNFPNPPQPTVFFRRQVVEKIGLLDEALHYALDYNYWVRAIQYYDFSYVDALWADYLIHPESKTGQGWKSFDKEVYRTAKEYSFLLKLKDRIDLQLFGSRHIEARHWLDLAYDAAARNQNDEARRLFRTAVRIDPTGLANVGLMKRWTRLK